MTDDEKRLTANVTTAWAQDASGRWVQIERGTVMCSPMDTSASVRAMTSEATARQAARDERMARLNRRAPAIQAILDHPTIDPTVADPDARLAASRAFWTAMIGETASTTFYPAEHYKGLTEVSALGTPKPPSRDKVVADRGFGGTRKLYASEAV